MVYKLYIVKLIFCKKGRREGGEKEGRTNRPSQEIDGAYHANVTLSRQSRAGVELTSAFLPWSWACHTACPNKIALVECFKRARNIFNSCLAQSASSFSPLTYEGQNKHRRVKREKTTLPLVNLECRWLGNGSPRIPFEGAHGKWVSIMRVIKSPRLVDLWLGILQRWTWIRKTRASFKSEANCLH